MKKPEWFELTKNDEPNDRHIKSKAPAVAFVIIGLIISLFLIVPSNTGNSPTDTQPTVNNSPTAEPAIKNPEVINSPISKPGIKNHLISNPTGGDNEDEGGEQEDDEIEEEDIEEDD